MAARMVLWRPTVDDGVVADRLNPVILRRLERKGLVEVVTASPEDTGPRRYRLTDAGWRRARGVPGEEGRGR
jgi:hypothetical protein